MLTTHTNTVVYLSINLQGNCCISAEIFEDFLTSTPDSLQALSINLKSTIANNQFCDAIVELLDRNRNFKWLKLIFSLTYVTETGIIKISRALQKY